MAPLSVNRITLLFLAKTFLKFSNMTTILFSLYDNNVEEASDVPNNDETGEVNKTTENAS